VIKSELQPMISRTIISRTEVVCLFSPSSLSPLRERQWLVSMCLTFFILGSGLPNRRLELQNRRRPRVR